VNKILKAFTLIELLVVIAVIGVLSGLIVVSMSGTTDKATIAKGQIFSSSLRNSLMLNIVAEWNFENSSNLGFDSWSNNNCTNVGTPVQATDCMSGNCLSLNGTANNLSCANNNNLQITGDQTIEMWLYPTDLTARRNPINKAYGGEGTITQEIGGTFNYYWGTSGINAQPYQGVGTGSYAIALNKWSHVAVIRNLSATSKTIKWYFNGALIVTATASYSAATASSEAILIGAGYCSPYHGKIDSLRLYNSVVSVMQLRENYYTGLNSLLINGIIDKEEYLSRINLTAVNE
jgi:prepilin-type N-terminal cleavage/methylation domain-containing protein